MTDPDPIKFDDLGDTAPPDHGTYKWTMDDDRLGSPINCPFDCEIDYEIQYYMTEQADNEQYVEFRDVRVTSLDTESGPRQPTADEALAIESWLLDLLQSGQKPAETISNEILEDNT